MSASALHRQLAHNDFTRPNSNFKAVTMARAKPARLEARPPPLPPNCKDHRQFYGFHINEERVLEYASRRCKNAKELNLWSTIIWFLFHLRRKAVYEDIQLEFVVADQDPPPDATIRHGPTGIPQIPIFSICAWEVEDWAARPTLEDIEAIQEIIGTEPRWYTDVNDPEDYENEN
ncbi:hypothetical protein GALMADRAFT_223590 [Galerina marginata CBS 339.88]|uniref:Uncharacterized protein n=1 Tax=Galerina marginata (strain CBS 339.88) TaxID=685588 RepID=A0A067T845_GALM3|nr:hypothetical protein GALMADRAFT_223590 [Galerina marginata CBS 339.88]